MASDVCRLCSSTGQLIDIQKLNVDDFKKLTMCIAFATGISIEENVLNSKMVCRCCCEQVLMFYKYRIEAIHNDKKLKDECGQSCLTPITDIGEITRLSKEIVETGFDNILLNKVDQLKTNREHYENDIVEILETDNSFLTIESAEEISNEVVTSNGMFKNRNLPTNIDKIVFSPRTNFDLKFISNHIHLRTYADKIKNINKRTQLDNDVHEILKNRDVILIEEENECKIKSPKKFKKISLASPHNIQNSLYLPTVLSNITSSKHETNNQEKPKNEKKRNLKQIRVDDLIRNLQVKTQKSSNSKTFLNKNDLTLPNALVPKTHQPNVKHATPKLNILSHYLITDSAITEVKSLKNGTEESIFGSNKSANHTCMHPYIKKLLEEHNSLVIPKELYSLNIEPKVILDKNAVIDWYITQVDYVTRQLDLYDVNTQKCLKNNNTKYFLRKRKFKRMNSESTDYYSYSEQSHNEDFSSGSDDNYVSETEIETGEDTDGDENIKKIKTYKKIKKGNLYNSLISERESNYSNAMNTHYLTSHINTNKNMDLINNENNLLQICSDEEKVTQHLQGEHLLHYEDSPCFSKNLQDSRLHSKIDDVPIMFETSNTSKGCLESNTESLQNNLPNFYNQSHLKQSLINTNHFSNPFINASQKKTSWLNSTTLPSMTETQQGYKNKSLHYKFQNQQYEILMREIDLNIRKLQKCSPPSYEEWAKQRHVKSTIRVKSLDELTKK